MNQATPILPVTPWHKPTESLLGYALRVSEKNGYETPTHILDYAGITRREALSPFFPIERLAAILGKQSKDLVNISYSTRTSAGALQFRLLGHSLGQSFNRHTYRLERPAFCPQCVAEKGFLEAHWDVASVTACPRHTCKLLSICPVCNTRVAWHRQGLLKCVCGAEWADIRPEPADATTIELQAILIARVQNKPINSSLSAGMPIDHLSSLPLHVLLSVIRIIGQSAVKATKLTSVDSYEIVAHAAHVFSQWPVNYEHHLDGITAWGKEMGLKHFLTALGRAGITEEVGNFLRLPIRNRMSTSPSLKSKSKRTATRAAPILVIEHPKPAKFNSLGERRAAAFLEIPVHTLRSLRAAGHYKVLNIPIPTSAYHTSDLEIFRQEILKLVPRRPPADLENQETLSLGYALRNIKFLANSAKGCLIGAIMNGHISAVGRGSDRIPDIILRKSDVIAFRNQIRSKAEGNTLSFAEAAASLCCDPSILPAMVREGMLQTSGTPTGIRISESSVTQFGAKHVSVAKLAKEHGTSSTKLQRELLRHNIPLRRFERSHHNSAQAFISVEYADKYNELFEKLKSDALRNQQATSEIAVSARSHAVARLVELLNEGIGSDTSLPRRGGKLNKRAIAKICGLSRDIFYDNLEIKELCKLFDTNHPIESVTKASSRDRKQATRKET